MHPRNRLILIAVAGFAAFLLAGWLLPELPFWIEALYGLAAITVCLVLGFAIDFARRRVVTTSGKGGQSMIASALVMLTGAIIFCAGMIYEPLRRAAHARWDDWQGLAMIYGGILHVLGLTGMVVSIIMGLRKPPQDMP